MLQQYRMIPDNGCILGVPTISIENILTLIGPFEFLIHQVELDQQQAVCNLFSDFEYLGDNNLI